MVDHADIAAAEDVCAAAVFLDGQRDVGTFFLDHVITPSAGLRAGAAVGSPAREVIGQKASAGVRDAHCAVNETFEFDISRDSCTDLPNLVKGDLTREDDPFRAL